MASIKDFFKKNLLTGFAVSIPAIITVVVIVWFFHFMEGFMAPSYDKIFGRHIPFIGFIFFIALIFAIGIISRNVLGKRIILFFENLFKRLPVFKGIYSSIKQIVDAFNPDNKELSFKRFVIVEYPRPGAYAFGFLTKECKVHAKGEVKNLKTVYIPTNNLYMGDIVLFTEDAVISTDIPVDEGINIILSGGLATPQSIKGVSL